MNTILEPTESAADQDSPWRTEPSADEVRAEQHLRGATFEDARADLRRRLAGDARRLAATAPAASEEIAIALAAADEAKQKADQLLIERQAALDSLESLIYSLGDLRLKIRAVQSLTLSDAGEKQLAHRALSFQIARQGAGTSSETESGFRSALQSLANLKALTPFIPEFVAPLEAQAAEIVKTIRADAETLGVDLHQFMSTLAAEARANRPGARLSPAIELYDGLWK